jgi:hypothetical protein
MINVFGKRRSEMAALKIIRQAHSCVLKLISLNPFFSLSTGEPISLSDFLVFLALAGAGFLFLSTIPLFFCPLVSVYDFLNQWMAHNILFSKIHEFYARYVREDIPGLYEP